MFEKALWKEHFTNWPTWPCPACNSVSLTLPAGKEREKYLLVQETGPSAQAQSHDAWEPDWMEKRFSALFKCHNPACGELVSASGLIAVEEYYWEDGNGDDGLDHQDRYEPRYFCGAPPVFIIPKACPKNVSNQLIAAFGLLWCDAGAAANRLRAGAEELLDDQKVQKAVSKKRRKDRLSLHKRIELLEKKDKDAASYLMAIKWLGNIGSHGDAALSREDVLSAMELFEAAVERLYVKSAQKYARLAAAINKRKGNPPRKPKKRP